MKPAAPATLVAAPALGGGSARRRRPPSAGGGGSSNVVAFSKGDSVADPLASESIPAWARRGVSWRGIREVFDEHYVRSESGGKPEALVETERGEASLKETMHRYSTLYDEVGLRFLHETCADIAQEREEDVRERMQATSGAAGDAASLGASVLARSRTTRTAASSVRAGSGVSALSASMSRRAGAGGEKGAANGEEEDGQGTAAYCFNCRKSGHTHGTCRPRRCYICLDPGHDAFVCVANPAEGSEFFIEGRKCKLCGMRGHDDRHCKARGGPWQGKPGYAHLPDTTFPRPLVIHVGSRRGGSSADAVAEASAARDVVCRLFEQYRSEDAPLVKLMREAELFCAALPLLGIEQIAGAQRASLRHALDVLRPAVAGVDLATFGVARPSATALAPRPGRGPGGGDGGGGVLDDDAALNELRTSSLDFNVVFANRIERYGRSQHSGEFRVGLQRIQAKCGMKPHEIAALYDEDPVAAGIHAEVVEQARREAEAERLAVMHGDDAAATGSASDASGSRPSSRSQRQHHRDRSSPRATSAGSTGGSSGGGGGSRSPRTKVPKPPTPSSAESSKPVPLGRLRQAQSPNRKQAGNESGGNANTASKPAPSSPTGDAGKSIFRGTIVRQMANMDPAAAEKRARARREAAGEATLMRWTRLLSANNGSRSASQTTNPVLRVTEEEAASSSNTDISRRQLRTAAEQDLLRLMKAAVNKGGANAADAGGGGGRARVPRVQHGTIGRDSIIRAWAEQGAAGAPQSSSSSSSPASSARRRAHGSEHAAAVSDDTFMTQRGGMHNASTASFHSEDDDVGGSSPASGRDSRQGGGGGLVFAGVPLQHDPTEPIRNWNSHRVAMAWGREQADEERRQAAVAEARRRKEAGVVADTKEERDRERRLLAEAEQPAAVQQLRRSRIDVWLHARDRYAKSRADAEAKLAARIAGGGGDGSATVASPTGGGGAAAAAAAVAATAPRREERAAAHREYEATMDQIGRTAPMIADVIDPGIVAKWRSRFQTARIRAGVKDAAIKDSRLVHRSVVATARLGGAAICAGATKRAERWLRSHRDVETEDATTSMISDNSSAWTVLCHRIAIAAVRVKAKRELAEELRAFLRRLPRGRATQDESIRMVERFERMVYGEDEDDTDSDSDSGNDGRHGTVASSLPSGESKGNKRKEKSPRKRQQSTIEEDLLNHSISNASLLFGKGDEAFRSWEASPQNPPTSPLGSPHVKWLSTPRAGFDDSSVGDEAGAQKRGGGKSNLDRCLEEWMLGDKKKQKKAQPIANAAVSDAAAQGGAPVPRPPSALGARPGSSASSARPASALSSRSGAPSAPASAAATPAAAAATAPARRSGSSDLDHLLSAPVTAQDVELIIQRACRESYAALFDDDFLRRALPSTVKAELLPKNDPRRSAPRTAEGEVIAAFLRWLVSPGAVEGQIGRVVKQ